MSFLLLAYVLFLFYQNLLSYGEYSLFKKWVVIVEGDFVQIRFNRHGDRKLVSKDSDCCQSLKVQKK